MGRANVTFSLVKRTAQRHIPAVTNNGAYLLRENTGTTGIVQTARLVAATLAEHDIPHLIVGGLAVQEHGYPRVTLDVDIVVPDVLEAVELLTAALVDSFAREPGYEDSVRDRRNGTLVNLLPAGKVLRRGCRVPFPEPKEVSDQPKLASLEDLTSLKLDSWANRPTRRHKDKTDVIELIVRRKLPRDFAVRPAVRQLYEETWDALAAEK